MTSSTENSIERRNKQRFHLHRELRFKLLDRAWSNVAGTGQTVDISSAGISFTTDQPLPVDAAIEISISWPVTLENACPLRLVARGRVVRSQGGCVACTIQKFEFRTQARASTVSILAGMCASRTQVLSATA